MLTALQALLSFSSQMRKQQSRLPCALRDVKNVNGTVKAYASKKSR
jgi:hypothetical protein